MAMGLNSKGANAAIGQESSSQASTKRYELRNALTASIYCPNVARPGLRPADFAQESRIHPDRAGRAGDRHRGEQLDLFGGRYRAAEAFRVSAAGPGSAVLRGHAG